MSVVPLPPPLQAVYGVLSAIFVAGYIQRCDGPHEHRAMVWGCQEGGGSTQWSQKNLNIESFCCNVAHNKLIKVPRPLLAPVLWIEVGFSTRLDTNATVIGVSLSELHSSGTALLNCVCNARACLLAATYQKFELNRKKEGYTWISDLYTCILHSNLNASCHNLWTPNINSTLMDPYVAQEVTYPTPP